jgi:hypothetical protein
MSSETISTTGSLPVMTGAEAGAGALWCFGYLDGRFGERRWGAVGDTCNFLTNLGKSEIVDEAPGGEAPGGDPP